MSKKIKESREIKFVKSGENKNLVTLATAYTNKPAAENQPKQSE